MKRRRPVVLGVLAVAAVATAAAVATSASGGARKTLTLAYVPPVIANPIIKAGNDAMAIEAKSLGMKFSTVGGEYNPQAQIGAVAQVVVERQLRPAALDEGQVTRPGGLDQPAGSVAPRFREGVPRANPVSP